jgi:glyoxylase-like metal-dependent hydrolase (beta-lactamase superfamily II)
VIGASSGRSSRFRGLGAGRILFDTGLHPQIATDPVSRLGEAGAAFPVEMNPGGDLVSQLEKLDLTMSDVDAVIQSHLHFDHAGCLEFVGDAPVYVHSAELAAARKPPVISATSITRQISNTI